MSVGGRPALPGRLDFSGRPLRARAGQPKGVAIDRGAAAARWGIRPSGASLWALEGSRGYFALGGSMSHEGVLRCSNLRLGVIERDSVSEAGRANWSKFVSGFSRSASQFGRQGL